MKVKSTRFFSSNYIIYKQNKKEQKRVSCLLTGTEDLPANVVWGWAECVDDARAVSEHAVEAVLADYAAHYCTLPLPR
jgi:hypothetical protein